MNHFTFVKRLFFVLVLTIIFIVLSGNYAGMRQHTNFAWMTTAIFSFFCIVVYFVAKKMVANPNRTLFIGMTITNMLGKMIVSVALVLIYKKMENPSDTLFIVPFLFIYVIFTIFETHFLLQIANNKKSDE